MIKRLFLIANTQAGSSGDGLSVIEQKLNDAGITYRLAKVSEKDDLAMHLKQINDTYDAVAVYAGDGTVARVAHAIYQMDIPLLVLPGGTANAIAMGLGQPLDAAKALDGFLQGQYETLRLDMAFRGTKPFVLDMHYGLLARTIDNASRELKQNIGAAAYFVEAFKQLSKLKTYDYVLKIDGKTIEATAVVCFIANSGTPQLLGRTVFSPHRSIDGQLDVVLCKTAKFWPLLSWYIKRAFFKQASGRAVSVYRAKHLEIIKAPAEALCDDEIVRATLPTVITIKQGLLPVLVPLKKTLRARLQNGGMQFLAEWFRFTDHLRRMVLGTPFVQFSQIDTNLFVGGQPARRGLKILQKQGITAVVSMRMSKPHAMPEGVKLLHLPTPDHTPIALKDITKGVEFINKEIADGGKVYVHCHLGEGRAASMAMAYLMSQGMFLNSSLERIKNRRRFIRPNERQLARLREFAHQQQVQKGDEEPLPKKTK